MKNIIIAGGAPGKSSGVIDKLYQHLGDTEKGIVMCHNGEKDLPDVAGHDLVYWLVDINNIEKKQYPRKDLGAVLICSKVMRKETTRIDAVGRIFRMGGNAVIMIHKDTKPFRFELVDALNNTWCRTTSIKSLADAVNKLYKWTKGSRRRSLTRSNEEVKLTKKMAFGEIKIFLEVNKKLAEQVANQCGNRHFGNYSTRCTKLFPSQRVSEDFFLFSPRNVDKRFVGLDDLVLTTHEKYYDDRKPSVDTPIQLEIYKRFPTLNFMIHGHAVLEGAPTTSEYFPCGDLREVPEVLKLIENGHHHINLKNHGFLLVGRSVHDFTRCIDELRFSQIGN